MSQTPHYRRTDLLRIAVLALAACAVGPALAEEFVAPEACLETQIAENAPIAVCVTEVHEPCLALSGPSLTGADCFRRAKAHWGELIARRMDEIGRIASEDLAAIAAIEVRYDLKANLLQCDRLEELSLVRKDPDDETVYTRMRCEAMAVGMAYAKLYYQSQQIR